MGVFSCRREAWLGFNPHWVGFGGEEWYLHTKWRQAGRRCLCLPFLRWNHRTSRPHGPPFPVRKEEKVANYILGHLELGIPLDRCYEHFVISGDMPKRQWESILCRCQQIQPTPVPQNQPINVDISAAMPAC